MRLQNGESTRFWSANWTPFGDLTTFLSGTNSRMGIPRNAMVSTLYSNGVWCLPPATSEARIQLYTHLTTLHLTANQDYYEWKIEGRVHNTYKTCTVYDYLRESKPDVQWHGAVWFSKAILRHTFHTSLVIQNFLPIRDRLISWDLQVDDRCLLCNAQPESRDQNYFSYAFSNDLWQTVTRRLQLQPSTTWQDTIDRMISLPSPLPHRLLILLAWQATLYWL